MQALDMLVMLVTSLPIARHSLVHSNGYVRAGPLFVRFRTADLLLLDAFVNDIELGSWQANEAGLIFQQSRRRVPRNVVTQDAATHRPHHSAGQPT